MQSGIGAQCHCAPISTLPRMAVVQSRHVMVAPASQTRANGQAIALWALGLVIALFALLQAVPALDITFHQPIFHFYIVTFTAFTAAVVAWLVVASVGENVAPCHRLFGLAFALMGSLFFLHGLTTPGALIAGFHPEVTWSAWLTLLVGGAIFALSATLAPEVPLRGWEQQWKRILLAAIGAMLAYAAIVFFAPGWLTAIERLTQPWTTKLLFAATFALWLVAALRLWRTYRRGAARLDGLMALTAALLACASISMHFFPIWHLSWWAYHILLLIGFTLTMVGLWRTYERRRTFRLTSYFAAASLIVIAALALGLSELYARLSNDDFVRHFEAENATYATNLARSLAPGIPVLRSAQTVSQAAQDGALRLWLKYLADLGVMELTVYDLEGQVVYQVDARSLAEEALSSDGPYAPPETSGHPAVHEQAFSAGLPGSEESQEWLQQVVAGKTVSEEEERIPPGGDRPVTVLATYAPVFPAAAVAGQTPPIAVLELVRPIPELEGHIIAVRARTVTTTGLAMTALFLLPLGIVRRADKLIQTRTQELEQTNAELKRSEALRNDLTQMIVHDLRSPLSAAFANLSLLEKALDRPDLAGQRTRFLANVRRSSQAMATLIDTLLDINRMEAGELPLNRQPVAIAELLQAGAEQAAGVAEQQGKHIRVETPPDLPQALVDRDLIGRVIHNLVQNALKHTAPGDHITLAARAENGYLVVSVQDDGEGIPPEYHAHIFEKFAQVNKAARNGSGLGLAFCRLAVEAHGGRISVESQPHQGSTFTFTLPLQPNA